MTRVMVPVRHLLSKHSRATLEEAVCVSREHDAELMVLHADLHQSSRGATWTELKRVVKAESGPFVHVRYVVRRGFLVEETILEGVAAEETDIVIIGSRRASRWRRMLHRFLDNPDIDVFLREKLDCTVITVRVGD